MMATAGRDMPRQDGAQQSKMGQPSKDRWIPWVFVAFFVVVVSMNGVMTYFAFDTWTGLTVTNAYERGLRHNDEIAEARAQAALGWVAELEFSQTGDTNGRMLLTLSDQWGTGLEQAAVRARLIRPTHEGYDFETDLVPAGPGQYAAEIDFPLAGQWSVEIRADHERGTYRLDDRLFLR